MIWLKRATGLAGFAIMAALMAVPPLAQAASPKEIRAACVRKIQAISPPLESRLVEHAIINCVADATPKRTKKKKQKPY